MTSVPRAQPNPKTSIQLEVEEFTTWEQVQTLEPLWNGLVLASEDPSLYLTFEWFSSWWQCHGKGKRLLVLTVREGTRVIAIAPLMKVGMAFGLIQKVHFISMMRNANSPLNYAASLSIIATERMDEVVQRIFEHLQQKHRWHFMKLHPIREGSHFLDALERLAAQRSLQFHKWTVFQNACVDTEGGWEAYNAKLSKGLRKSFRRVERRLHELGEVKYGDYRSIDELPNGFDDIDAIEKKSWKWRQGMPISAPRYRGFYRKLAEACGRKGWLHLRTLEVTGNKIAYDFNIDFEGRVESMKASYDHRYEKYSPGTLLLHDVLKQFFRSGVTRINMLWGVFGYKRRVLTHLETHCEIFLFNQGLVAKLLHFFLFRLSFYSRQLALKRWAWRLHYRLQHLNPLRDDDDRD